MVVKDDEAGENLAGRSTSAAFKTASAFDAMVAWVLGRRTSGGLHELLEVKGLLRVDADGLE